MSPQRNEITIEYETIKKIVLGIYWDHLGGRFLNLTEEKQTLKLKQLFAFQFKVNLIIDTGVFAIMLQINIKTEANYFIKIQFHVKQQLYIQFS